MTATSEVSGHVPGFPEPLTFVLEARGHNDLARQILARRIEPTLIVELTSVARIYSNRVRALKGRAVRRGLIGRGKI